MQTLFNVTSVLVVAVAPLLIEKEETLDGMDN